MLDGKLREFFKYSDEEKQYILERVNHYCRFEKDIFLPEDAPELRNFTYKRRTSYVHDYVNSTYFFDANEYVRFFADNLRWAYNPGDVNYLFPVPEITKSRPISQGLENRNNILLNLDKVRHFTWIYDPFDWKEKECKVLFRGDTKGKPHRVRFIDMWKAHPLCNLEGKALSIYDHLKYKYIMALEGNDVASNLKWVMSSNSIAVMPKPKFETWFMESRLIPNYHYIEIATDYHDLIERISYYEEHPEEAQQIVEHAHEYVRQFWNKKREDIISLMVLDKYFALTGQRESTVVGGNKYVVCDLVKLNNSQKINAQGKAREDVVRTLTDMGFIECGILNPKYAIGNDTAKRYHHYPMYSKMVSHYGANVLLDKLKYGDTILVQDFYLQHMQWLSTQAQKKGVKVVFLIHDIQCIRFDIHTQEIDQLNNAHLLLVHTEAMKAKLLRLGVTVPMKVINLFDYYSDDVMHKASDIAMHKSEIIFAGNLSKSAFLERINRKVAGSVVFNLYGFVGEKDFTRFKSRRYKGVFAPDHTGKIAGGWGLVWDGDSIDGCTGDYGTYLKYNSSHKVSLYLACGIPLIVWTQSSLVSFVTEHNIGITIERISDISRKVNEITREQYQQMILNAHAIGKQLRNGEYLRAQIE